MIYKKRIPIYYGQLQVIISKDFTKYGDFDKSVNDYPAVAIVKSHKGAGKYAILIKPKKIKDNSIIAHEALHIVNYIFDDRKIKLDPVNDEPQCYLLGWVVEQVEKAIKKYGKPHCN